VELILGEAEVWSHQRRKTVQKGHNFLSDHLIALKFLLEFLESVFLGVDLEMLSSSNFYRSFRRPFSLE
jgi:hypothetical protein